VQGNIQAPRPDFKAKFRVSKLPKLIVLELEGGKCPLLKSDLKKTDFKTIYRLSWSSKVASDLSHAFCTFCFILFKKKFVVLELEGGNGPLPC
jgi:hypothetical protein